MVSLKAGMNCPSCSAPMLFGATSCVCGYHAVGAPSVIGVSYWEAMRAWWRACWPVQLIGILLLLWLLFFVTRAVAACSAACVVVFTAVLFVLAPRLVSGRYRDFSLVVVATPGGGTGDSSRLNQRRRVWFFLWWRYLVASLLAGLGATLVSTVAFYFLQACGVGLWRAMAVAWWQLIIGLVLVHVFIVGPVLVKMLVGRPFPGFLIEARRGCDWAFSPGGHAAGPTVGGPRNAAP